MTILNYFTTFDDCRADTLSRFKGRLSKLPKKRVGEVTLLDLCTFTEYPNGLYFFFDDDDRLWYVGKATSRSFIERIPSHFDTRENAWFNTLPKKIMDVCAIDKYDEAHALGLSLRLVLLGVKTKQTAINLERGLRDYLQPQLNKISKQKAISTTLLSTYEA